MDEIKTEAAMSIPVREIFSQIEEDFLMIDQWKRMECYHRVMQYQARVEGFIELIEAIDCQSYGGWDRRDPLCGKHQRDCVTGLRSRFEWLKTLRGM